MSEIRYSRAQKLAIIIERDGDTCHLCQTGFYDEDGNFDETLITFDHYLPRSKGGSDEVENLKLSHRLCNSKKGNREHDEDGKLPPIPKRTKAVAKRERPPVCEKCNAGRLIKVGENCNICGSGPQPTSAPRTLQLSFEICKHTGKYYCKWCFVGFVPRKDKGWKL